jgi:hypothetical protein
MDTKTCSKCGIEKPLSDFPKAKQCKDGYLGFCKECKSKQDREYSAQYRIDNKDKEKKRHAKYHKDNRDREVEKKRKYRKEHPEADREYYLKNKEKLNEQSRENYRNNKERYSELGKRYYQNHKEETAAYAKKYRAEHKEETRERRRKWKKTPKGKENEKRYYERNKEKILPKMAEYYLEVREEHLERSMKWAKDNPDKYKIIMKRYKQSPKGKIMDKNHNHRRRELLGHGDGITLDQWIKILEIQNHRCNECGRKFSKKLKATEDHIIPLAKGGLHEFSNIQALCGKCNSTKNANLDKEYIHTWITEGVAVE